MVGSGVLGRRRRAYTTPARAHRIYSPTIFLSIASTRLPGLERFTCYLHLHWALGRWCIPKHLLTRVKGQGLFFLVLSNFHHRAFVVTVLFGLFDRERMRQCPDLGVVVLKYFAPFAPGAFLSRGLSFFSSCDTRL